MAANLFTIKNRIFWDSNLIQRVSKSVFPSIIQMRKNADFQFLQHLPEHKFFKISTLVQFHWAKIHLKTTLSKNPRSRERISAISADFLRDFRGLCRKPSVFRISDVPEGYLPAIVSDDSSSILARTRCTRCYLSLRHFPRHRGSISNQLIILHVCVTTTVPLFV